MMTRFLTPIMFAAMPTHLSRLAWSVSRRSRSTARSPWVAGTAANQGFFNGLAASFERTFVKEGRYKMILSGLGMTVLIAVTAAAIGLALAYGLVFTRRMDRPVANRLISGYNSLIAGIPAAVILMVLYYIIFASAKFSPVLVAVIGFALIYCSRAYGIIWNGVTSVDGGQREAALALGYDEGLAFRKVILPQSERYYRPLLFPSSSCWSRRPAWRATSPSWSSPGPAT